MRALIFVAALVAAAPAAAWTITIGSTRCHGTTIGHPGPGTVLLSLSCPRSPVPGYPRNGRMKLSTFLIAGADLVGHGFPCFWFAQAGACDEKKNCDFFGDETCPFLSTRRR